MTNTYTADGVDVPLGDAFSAIAGAVGRASWTNSRYVRVIDHAQHNFRGPKSLSFVGLPEGSTIDEAADGIGTKTNLTTAAMLHRHTYRDVLAMTTMDHLRWGGLPLVFSNVLDVASLGESQDSKTFLAYKEAIQGLGEAAAEIDIVLYRGETAELGVNVGGDDPGAVTKYNCSGFVIGASHPDKLITGADISPGDTVIALRERRGFRSNGISSVRKALAIRFGKRWWTKRAAQEAIRSAAEPSVLYDRFFATMNGWYAPKFAKVCPVKAIAHITGGGIPGKFANDILFPLGLSASLPKLYPPPDMMRNCAMWRGMTDWECYDTWHGGQGVLAVVAPCHADLFCNQAILAGHEAQKCGYLFEAPRQRLVIHSQFWGGTLSYCASGLRTMI